MNALFIHRFIGIQSIIFLLEVLRSTMSETLPKLTICQQVSKKNMPQILGRSIINFSKISNIDCQKTADTHNPMLKPIRVDISIPERQRVLNRTQRPSKLFAFQRYLKRHTISRYPKKQLQKKSQKKKKFEFNDELFTQQMSNQNPDIKISTKNNLFLIKPKINLYDSQPRFFSKEKQMYRFYVGPGNNGELVREILQSKKCWIETTQYDTLFNLRWEQYTDKNLYDKIVFDQWRQTVNHFKMHQQISTKSGLLKSLKKYCSRNSINIFDFVPISFILDLSNPSKLQEQLKKFVFYFLENHPKEVNVRKDRCYIQFAKSLSYCMKLSNFSFQKTITSGIPPLDETYINSDQYIWLLKPSDLNRGRGIKIWNSLQSLSEILIKNVNKKINGDEFVIQKYIEKPLLINDRKFDIRVWVLLSQRAKLYIFQQGYIRTSCEEFDLNIIDNEYIHLTNNAIQKSNKKYGQFQDGNQISFDHFDRLFPQFSPFKNSIFSQIKRICSLTVVSGLKNIVEEKRKQAFQIFGFDFMLDYCAKVWLIEVNTNPCLETSSKLLGKLIPRMLDDAFKIVLDPIYPMNKGTTVYPVAGYDNEFNMWSNITNFPHHAKIV